MTTAAEVMWDCDTINSNILPTKHAPGDLGNSTYVLQCNLASDAPAKWSKLGVYV